MVNLRVQGQHGAEEVGGDFLVEARDWAGELISAQTTMGKILVGSTQGWNILMA